jgi:D-sedoheptulose 7-phosphate isomerase
MSVKPYFDLQLLEHAEVLKRTQENIVESFIKLVEDCVYAIRRSNKLLFFGNGGSASDAQHIATEFTVRFSKDRPAISALALTTDTSALTAIGNDIGFDNLYSRQVEALCRSGDVVIGISTSGNSENVIRGLETARRLGATTVALTGGNGGRLRACADNTIVVPSKTTARIQEMHITIGHMLCGAVEKELGVV